MSIPKLSFRIASLLATVVFALVSTLPLVAQNAPLPETTTATPTSVYLTNTSSASVSMYRSGTVSTHQACSDPNTGFVPAVTVSPDGITLWVACNDGGYDSASQREAAVINASTLVPIAHVAVTDNPRYIVVSPDGKTAYVLGESSKVTVIDTATHAVTTTFAMKEASGGEPYFMGGAISADGRYLYGADASSGLIIYDLVNKVVTNNIVSSYDNGTAGGNGAGWIALSPDGKTAYFPQSQSGNGSTSGALFIADLTTGVQQACIPLPVAGKLRAVSLNSTGTRAYVSQEGGYSYVIDTIMNTVVANVDLPDVRGIGITADDSTVYAVDGDYLVWFSTATNTFIDNGSEELTVGSWGGATQLDIFPKGTPKLATLPSVTTAFVSDMSTTSATLHASVIPHGTLSSSWIEYSTDSALKTYTATPVKSAGSGTVAVDVVAAVTGLTTGKLYYYRAAAKNGGGVVRGQIFSFTAGSTPKLALSWATPASIVYGTALSTKQLNATANVAGSFVYTPAAGAILKPGTQTLSVTFTPTDTAANSKATKTVQLVVNRAVLKATATNASRFFGVANPTFTYSLSGFVGTDTSAVVTGAPTLTTTATTASPAGTYPITCATGTLTAASYTFTCVNGTLSVNNAVPALNTLSPASTIPIGTTLTLTVNGGNFVNGSVVQWNGSTLPTTYLSNFILHAQVPSSDLLLGTAKVTVLTPAPGGGTSTPLTITITSPVPVLTSLVPATAKAGSADLSLTVNGFNFLPGAQVQWNGKTLGTFFTSETQLKATIPAADLVSAVTAHITVVNSAPSLHPSYAFTFTVQ